MIKISKELQELYATDGTFKTLKIYINDNTIISNDKISAETFTLTEILSDQEQITYGLCNSSKVEFTTIGDNTISEGTILKIVMLIGDDLTELPLGTYIVDSAKKQTNKQLKNIIAYDRLYNIDNTDMIYFYDKTVFPLTLKQLRDSFFSYVGITCEDIALLNDNLTVNQNNDFRNLSAREFLTQICELNAVFGKMSRNDHFVFLDIVGSVTETAISEFASKNQSQDITFVGYPIRTVETENFETKKINRIKVIEGGGAVLYNIGLGNDEPNYYNIKDNFLLTGRTADDETLKSTINTLYAKMNSLYYMPCNITAKGLPYLETGDLIQITKDNQNVRTYILSRTLKGIIALTDTYTANGVNTLREVYSAEQSISQNVYNNYQSNRLNYITSQNGERIILPTERTNAITQTFGNTDDLSNFEYMAVITATIEVGGNIQFEYRVDGETLDTKPIQSAYSPTSSISAYSLEEDSTNVTHQQIVLYLPQTNSAIGTHTFEVDVISNATGYIDKNHWVSCWKGQNITTTDKAVVSIVIIDLPNKLVYSKGEALDLTGLVVCANYIGGAKKILSSSEYTVTADTSTVGTQPVVISYKENPQLTANFNIEVSNEYLKVSESNIGQRFLESYTTQSVYTSVYWVHEVDGIMTETYLSTSEFQSWECDSLEPSYYTNGDKQYVGYYQTPTNSGFGQHDMKISYKSPDTGNILSIEYPIYYLEEKSFSLPFDSYDWYPFRNPFAFYSIGNSKVLYQCKDKKGNTIEESLNVPTSITEMAFYFPEVSNAQYKFGENQTVKVCYISNSLKEYNPTFKINIRPYYDTRNNECNYSGTSTNVKKYYYKNLSPLKLKIDLNKKAYSGLLNIKDHTSTENADLYSVDSLSVVGYKQSDTFYFYNTQNQIENVFEEKGKVIEYNSIDIKIIGGKNKGTQTSCFSNDSSRYNGYTIGFAYWGDGTLSQVMLTQRFYNNTGLKYANITGLITSNNMENLRLRNGYFLNENSKQFGYSDSTMFDCTHIYDSKGIYSIEMTCSYGCYYEDNNFYSNFGSVTGSETSLGGYEGIMPNASTMNELYSSTDEKSWIRYGLHISNSDTACITEFEFGDTSLFNYQKNSSNTVQNSGYETFCKFATDTNSNIIFDKLSNLQKVSIPKISKYYTYNNTQFIPFYYCLNLETIDYSGSINDFINLSSNAKSQFTNGFIKGQNLHTLEYFYADVTINCIDGTIALKDILS